MIRWKRSISSEDRVSESFYAICLTVRGGMTLAWKLDKTHAHGFIISGLYLGIAVFVVEEGWA